MAEHLQDSRLLDRITRRHQKRETVLTQIQQAIQQLESATSETEVWTELSPELVELLQELPEVPEQPTTPEEETNPPDGESEPSDNPVKAEQYDISSIAKPIFRVFAGDHPKSLDEALTQTYEDWVTKWYPATPKSGNEREIEIRRHKRAIINQLKKGVERLEWYKNGPEHEGQQPTPQLVSLFTTINARVQLGKIRKTIEKWESQL